MIINLFNNKISPTTTDNLTFLLWSFEDGHRPILPLWSILNVRENVRKQSRRVENSRERSKTVEQLKSEQLKHQTNPKLVVSSKLNFEAYLKILSKFYFIIWYFNCFKKLKIIYCLKKSNFLNTNSQISNLYNFVCWCFVLYSLVFYSGLLLPSSTGPSSLYEYRLTYCYFAYWQSFSNFSEY